MTSDHYDVAIIGAGPAGCACALALHKSGLRVALIDKETFPRDKICEDAIPGLTFKAMDRINAEWGAAMRNFAHKANIHISKVFAPNGKHITLHWKAFAYNSRRLHFDDFLMGLVRSDTDTHVFENTRLTEVSFGSDDVACHFQDGWIIKASIIIGCDGANSMVTKCFGRTDHSHSSVCVPTDRKLIRTRITDNKKMLTCERNKIFRIAMSLETRNTIMYLGEIYFWTDTIKGWKRLLKQDKYKQIVADSWKWLAEKDLVKTYGFVVMPNHLHVIWEMVSKNGKEMPHASFNKFTAINILKDLQENHPRVLPYFKVDEKEREYRIWQRDPLAVLMDFKNKLEQKLNYIHSNPLSERWNLAERPEEYFWSSARFYKTGKDEFGFLTHYAERYG